jgi:hypothetical protein
MSPIIHDSDALVALGHSLQAAGYRFTTVTPATHERVNARLGNAWATDLRGVFGWSRPFPPDRARSTSHSAFHAPRWWRRTSILPRWR